MKEWKRKRDNNASVRVASWLPSTESESLLSFSGSVVSDSGAHGLQQARLSCPPLSPGVCSNSVHWVSDAIQPSRFLLPPSPPALNLSQHQDLFQWVSFLHQVAKVSPSNEYSGLILQVHNKCSFYYYTYFSGCHFFRGLSPETPKGEGAGAQEVCPQGQGESMEDRAGFLSPGSWSTGSLLPTAPYF